MMLSLFQMSIERERACDNLVLNGGCKASDYAAHLLDIARNLRRVPQVPAIAMARSSHLEGRIVAIVDASRVRRPPRTALVGLCCFGALAFVAGMAAQKPQAYSPPATSYAEPWLDETSAKPNSNAEAGSQSAVNAQGLSAAGAQSPLTAENQFTAPFADFKRLLCSTGLTIKYLSLIRGWINEPTNWSFYEGSLQPRTFYVKETIKANGRTITSVAGASFDNVWRILDNGQIHVAAPDTNSGPSELEESIRQTHAGVRWLVEETFDLGMGRRKKDTLRWFGGDRFEASCDGIVLTDGNGHTFPGLGTLSGRLIGNDPRRPDSMEYAFSGRPGVKITVKYRYRQQWEPSVLRSALY